MVMRVQLVEGEYRVILPPGVVEALQLTDGAAVEILPVAGPARPDLRRMTIEDGLAWFRRTEPVHRDTYPDLTK